MKRMPSCIVCVATFLSAPAALSMVFLLASPSSASTAEDLHSLSAEDIEYLDRMKAERIEFIESYLKIDEKDYAEAKARERSKKRQPFPVNPWYSANTIEIRIKKKKEQIAALKKMSAFEMAVRDLSDYCRAIGKENQFLELAATSTDIADFADALPVIRYTVTSTEADGAEVVREEEFDPQNVAFAADVFAWGMKLEARAAAEEARKVFRELSHLSEDGLAAVKTGYAKQLASEAKKAQKSNSRGTANRSK